MSWVLAVIVLEKRSVGWSRDATPARLAGTKAAVRRFEVRHGVAALILTRIRVRRRKRRRGKVDRT
jgi:hypothetical protein